MTIEALSIGFLVIITLAQLACVGVMLWAIAKWRP